MHAKKTTSSGPIHNDGSKQLSYYILGQLQVCLLTVLSSDHVFFINDVGLFVYLRIVCFSKLSEWANEWMSERVWSMSPMKCVMNCEEHRKDQNSSMIFIGQLNDIDCFGQG